MQRDEQESRFTRDLIPGYAFTPDGKSVLAAYGGKIHRLDVQTGADQVIPFSARVSQPVGSRLNFPIRVDDGPVQARLIQDPEPSPDGKHLAFSALTKLYLMDLPDGKPRQLSAGDAREFHPSWSPDGKSLAYVSWAPEGGHIWKRSGDGQRRARAAHAGRRVLSRSGLVARRQADRGPACAAPRARSKTRSDSGAGARPRLGSRRRGRRHPDQPRPRREPAALRRGPRPDLHDHAPGPGLDAIRRHRPPHASQRHRQDRLFARASPSRPRRSSLRPDGRWALARVTNQLYLLALPRFGGEAPKVSVHEPSVPLKKLTDIGADYAAWADGGKTITWAIGSSFFRLPFDSVVFDPLKSEDDEKGEDKDKAEAEKKEQKPKPEELAVVVERPRHRPRGTIVLRGAKVITMRGDEVIPEGDDRRDRPPDRGRRARGLGQGARGGQGHRRHRERPSCPGSSTPTPTGRRSAAACSTCRTGASSPTSPTA